MYEMCAGPDAAGSVLAWHVKAREGPTTLCAQPLRGLAEQAAAERHGRRFMVSFHGSAQGLQGLGPRLVG